MGCDRKSGLTPDPPRAPLWCPVHGPGAPWGSSRVVRAGPASMGGRRASQQKLQPTSPPHTLKGVSSFSFAKCMGRKAMRVWMRMTAFPGRTELRFRACGLETLSSTPRYHLPKIHHVAVVSKAEHLLLFPCFPRRTKEQNRQPTPVLSCPGWSCSASIQEVQCQPNVADIGGHLGPVCECGLV